MTRVAALIAALALALSDGAIAQSSAPAEPAETASDQLPRFDLLELRVVGNTVLPPLAVETAVYPFLGPGRTIKDVDAARDALERAYREHGYMTVLVDIPEQKVKRGIVKLRVVEGKIGQVRVTGNRYYSRGMIREKVPSLAAGTVPNFQDVQRELASLSRSADRTVTPALMPGKAPGTVDVELRVEDRLPLHADVEINNRQSPDTKPLRLQASVRFDNLWQREHSASLLVQTAPQEPNSLQVFSGTYVMPLEPDGWALAMYGVYSNSDVAAVASTDVIGKGTIVGARAILPLPPAPGYSHSLAFGVDYKDFTDTVRLGADSFDTPITYVPASVQYRMNWTAGKGSHSGSLSVNAAPRGFFGNNDEEFENKRFNAQASYVYLRGNWLTEQQVATRTVLRVRFDGQLASQPLISNEEFAAGGAESVRGYLEAERLGDNGAVGSIELRQQFYSDLAGKGLQNLTGLAFLDAGWLQVIDSLPGQTSRFELSSAGLGLRAKVASNFDAGVDVAVPFRDGQITSKGDPRIHFRVAGQF